MIPFIEPLAVILSLSGAYLVASPLDNQRQTAFCIWMLANALWVVIGITTRSPYIALLFALYFLLSAKGYLSIGKGEKVGV
jgi:hypothetical protein